MTPFFGTASAVAWAMGLDQSVRAPFCFRVVPHELLIKGVFSVHNDFQAQPTSTGWVVWRADLELPIVVGAGSV